MQLQSFKVILTVLRASVARKYILSAMTDSLFFGVNFSFICQILYEPKD